MNPEFVPKNGEFKKAKKTIRLPRGLADVVFENGEVFDCLDFNPDRHGEMEIVDVVDFDHWTDLVAKRLWYEYSQQETLQYSSYVLDLQSLEVIYTLNILKNLHLEREVEDLSVEISECEKLLSQGFEKLQKTAERYRLKNHPVSLYLNIDEDNAMPVMYFNEIMSSGAVGFEHVFSYDDLAFAGYEIVLANDFYKKDDLVISKQDKILIKNYLYLNEVGHQIAIKIPVEEILHAKMSHTSVDRKFGIFSDDHNGEILEEKDLSNYEGFEYFDRKRVDQGLDVLQAGTPEQGSWSEVYVFEEEFYDFACALTDVGEGSINNLLYVLQKNSDLSEGLKNAVERCSVISENSKNYIYNEFYAQAKDAVIKAHSEGKILNAKVIISREIYECRVVNIVYREHIDFDEPANNETKPIIVVEFEDGTRETFELGEFVIIPENSQL